MKIQELQNLPSIICTCMRAQVDVLLDYYLSDLRSYNFVTKHAKSVSGCSKTPQGVAISFKTHLVKILKNT